MHEHESSNKYSAPKHYYGGPEVVNGIIGIGSTSMQSCQFTRPLSPSDNYHYQLPTKTPVSFLWAFNPINSKQKNFVHHSPLNRGSVNMMLERGFAIPKEVGNFQVKQIHGLGMMFIWLVLLPFGAFYARYFRSKKGWLLVKLIIQGTGVLLILVFASLMFFNSDPNLSNPHVVIGITLLALVLIQSILGFLSFLGLSLEDIEKVRTTIRMFHQISGYLLLMTSMLQMALGINVLYPWEDPREIYMWVIYIGLVSFWLILFSGFEVYHTVFVRRQNGIVYQKFAQTFTKANPMKADLQKKQDKVLLGAKEIQSSSSSVFTWESLDHAVNNGYKQKLLVVANGRYVYDISQWISSHPGGRIILLSVTGTDISEDYFNNAGFDAEHFVPRPDIPLKRNGSLTKNEAPTNELSASDMRALKRKSLDSLNSLRLSEGSKDMTSYSQDDWMYIQRSRRLHVHTRMAIERLSSMLVGKLVDISQDSSSMVSSSRTETDSLNFNIFEFRRYALTRISQVSDSLTVRLRFCLLYPYNERLGQPNIFLPGQCVEIQGLIGSERITRYYTPILGSMGSFEILVKIKPKGKMSQFFINQKPGDRQFKVRGPFGTPFCDFNTRLQYQSALPEAIYYFAGGSGITPCLQLLTYLFLSTGITLRVIQSYRAELSDEMNLTPGDIVRVQYHYMDGWCFGNNLTTNEQGSFPLGCTLPSIPMKVHIIQVTDNPSQMIGKQIIDGAQIAYPQLCTLVHTSKENLSINILNGIYSQYQSSKFIVCGPPAMNSTVIDMLAEVGLGLNEDMRILGGDMYN
ncbi:hypothetical protein HDV02_002551 [Globomyces sp. JEL0801]|nr:hypothetical protein HDV02_002551 [Globomyces sp. JEL0801]